MVDRVAKLLSDLRKGEFHVDCVRVELVRNRDGKKFAGPGYIRQKGDRDFEVKLYATGKLSLRSVLTEWGATQPGVVFSHHDHYSLSASDEQGLRWAANRIISPDTRSHVQQDGYIVTAECQEITAIENRWPNETNEWARLVTFDQIKFPATSVTEKTVKVGDTRRVTTSHRNVAELASHGLNLCFEADDGLVLHVSPKDIPLHPQLEWRLTDAMTFALGTQPRWSLIVRSEGKERVSRFRSVDRRTYIPPQMPPYTVELHDDSGAVWRMFNQYLDYVLPDRESHTHALSQRIISVVNTRSSTAEGHALAVAVAVESLLDLFYQSAGLPSSGLVAGVDDLTKHIEAWAGDPTVMKRAIGSVGGMKRARPEDRLRALVDCGIVSESGQRAWKKLRNTCAHGNWAAYEGKLQGLLDQTGAVVGLFNQLVFHLIGYEGPQTDYGTHGWPTIHYRGASPAPDSTGDHRRGSGESGPMTPDPL